MPGPLLHAGAVVTCPHAGMMSVVPPQSRVLAGAMPVATMAHAYPIAGCGNPSGIPCTVVQWVPPATRVLVNGAPAVLSTGVGTCLSAAGPAGAAVVMWVQARAVAT